MSDPVRVLAITRHGLDGSASRYRWYQYVPRLEKAGLRCSTATLFGGDYIARFYATGRRRKTEVAAAYARLARTLRKARDVDAVFVEKEAFPFVPHFAEKLLRPRGIPFVTDLDDAVFHQYDGKRLLAGKFPALYRGSAAVTAGAPYLARHARENGARRVELLPTVVDLDRYPAHPELPKPAKGLTVGWIGAPVTARYLGTVREPLAAFCRDTGSTLRTIGAGRARPEGLPGEDVAWTLEGEVDAMRAFDVGIMPLEDSPWERGKCGLKLIQYMAMGRPVVATPVGVNADLVEPGVNGFLASTPREWHDAFHALHDDPALRERMGRAGRALVEKEYSLRVAAPRLAGLLREVADG